MRGNPTEPGRTFVALSLAAATSAALLYVWVEKHPYEQLLDVSHANLGGDEKNLLAWMLVAKTLVLLWPAIGVGTVVAWSGRERPAYVFYALSSTLALSFVALDLAAYQTFGRHLREVTRFAALSGGSEAAGGAGQWVVPAARWVGFALAATAAFALGFRWVVSQLWSRATPAFAAALGWLTAAVLVVASLAPTPSVATRVFRRRDLVERLYGSFPLDLRRRGPSRASGDRAWDRAQEGLEAAYAAEFPLLFRVRPPNHALRPPASKPNVVLFVVESFRADVFDADHMPRLRALSSRGLWSKLHYAGSHYSEAGMFSLLYGRSPLLYHSVLDGKEPPSLCVAAHDVGYDCAYYTGQPLEWMRMEEFVNAHAFDRFVHDDAGSWNDWDRKAVTHLLEALRAPGSRPSMSVVYLMSTHFEYQYPPEYERHVPVARDLAWQVTRSDGFDEHTRQLLLNRYLNAVAFTDDLLADAVAALDPEKTLVVVTGDHGESIDDDGRYGHGYGFPDVVATVPFVLVGPGVAPRTVDGPTMHVDVLPTILDALGTSWALPIEGRSLLRDAAPRASVLLGHDAFNRDVADALFIHGGDRVRLELGLTQPSVRLLGWEDDFGHPAPASLDAARVAALASAFATELDVVRR